MKSYRITVNGNVYDVTVEETTGNEAATATHPVSNAGSVEIKSSVPGKIIAVEVSQGQAVKAGDTVVILESMKMEIPVVAPQDGTIASIAVSQGNNVHPEDNQDVAEDVGKVQEAKKRLGRS